MNDIIDIKYIDFLPGTGKTYWMASKLVRFLYKHIKNQKNAIEASYDALPQVVYVVAPTISLLLEIQKTVLTEFLRFVQKRYSDYDTISNFVSSAYNRMYRLYGVQATKDSLDEVVEIDDRIRIYGYDYDLSPSTSSNSYYAGNIKALLRDSSKNYNQSMRIAHYDAITNASSDDAFKCLNIYKNVKYEKTKDDKDEDFSKLTSQLSFSLGSIVFITEAAFWNANHDDSSDSKTFWNKQSAWLIMDEARSCNCTSLSITLSSKTSALISKVFGTSVFNKYVEIDKNFYRVPEIHDAIIEDSGESMLAKLDGYIRQHEGSSIFIRLTQATVKSSNRAVLAIVQIPYAAFTGWMHVTLMSAFFTESQLYAVLSSVNHPGCLKNSAVFRLREEDDIQTLRSNEELIRKCCSKSLITYVYDNESYISKRLYNNGVVYESSESFVDSLNKSAILSYLACKSSKDTQVASSFNKFNSLLDLVRYNRTHSLSETPLDFSGQYLSKIQPKLIFITPLEFAVKVSIKYAMAWLRDNAIDDRTISKEVLSAYLKNNLLINYNKYLGAKNKSLADDDIPRNLKQYYTSLTTDSRGINKYIKYRIISVLAAYNAVPAIDAWFSQFTKGYDSTKDYAISQCIQTMLRCKIRDKYDIQNTFIILSTKGLATDIAAKLGVKVVSPNEFLSNTKYSIAFANSVFSKKVLSEKQKIKMREYAAKSSTAIKAQARFSKDLSEDELYKKAYLKKYYEKSDERRKYMAVSASISRIKSKLSSLKDNNVNKSILLSKYSNLLNEQSSLSAACKAKKSQITLDFISKYTKDKDSVIEDVRGLTPLVKSQRKQLSKYYEKKALQLKQEEELNYYKKYGYEAVINLPSE